MSLRQRRRRQNFNHRIVTIRATGDLLAYLNGLSDIERAKFFNDAFKHYLKDTP